MSSPLLQDLQWRYATKQFDPTKKLTDEQIHELMEAVRLAPSSYGLQPRRFVVVSDQSIQDRLVEHAYGQQQIADASHLIVLCIKKHFGEEDVHAYVDDIVQTRGVPKDALEGYTKMMLGTVTGMSLEQRTHWMEKQVYIALGFLLSQAAHMRIDACPMEGFIADQFDQVLGLHDYQTAVICPVGYRSSEDNYADAKKVRFDNERIIDRRK